MPLCFYANLGYPTFNQLHFNFHSGEKRYYQSCYISFVRDWSYYLAQDLNYIFLVSSNIWDSSCYQKIETITCFFLYKWAFRIKSGQILNYNSSFLSNLHISKTKKFYILPQITMQLPLHRQFLGRSQFIRITSKKSFTKFREKSKNHA